MRTRLVDHAMKQLDIERYKNTLAGNLSGGNKRKLTIAIAIIGCPKIILLDEPTAGMDPESREFMWQLVI